MKSSVVTPARFPEASRIIISDFLMKRMRLGVIIIDFLIFHQKCYQNGSKIGRTSIDAVVLEKNGDQNRIPHGLKPNIF